MFRKIAEWLTGKKRSDTVHPLEYVEARREREKAKKEPEPTKAESINTNVVWVIGDSATSVPAPEPVVVKEEKPVTQDTGPWPFPVSPPEPTQEVVKPKKPRKPRTKKV